MHALHGGDRRGESAGLRAIAAALEIFDPADVDEGFRRDPLRGVDQFRRWLERLDAQAGICRASRARDAGELAAIDGFADKARPLNEAEKAMIADFLVEHGKRPFANINR